MNSLTCTIYMVTKYLRLILTIWHTSTMWHTYIHTLYLGSESSTHSPVEGHSVCLFFAIQDMKLNITWRQDLALSICTWKYFALKALFFRYHSLKARSESLIFLMFSWVTQTFSSQLPNWHPFCTSINILFKQTVYCVCCRMHVLTFKKK